MSWSSATNEGALALETEAGSVTAVLGEESAVPGAVTSLLLYKSALNGAVDVGGVTCAVEEGEEAGFVSSSEPQPTLNKAVPSIIRAKAHLGINAIRNPNQWPHWDDWEEEEWPVLVPEQESQQVASLFLLQMQVAVVVAVAGLLFQWSLAGPEV